MTQTPSPDDKDNASIDADEFGMWDVEEIDRREARFRLNMEPFEQRTRPRFPWGLALLFLLLAGIFTAMIIYGIDKMGVM